MNVRRGDIVLCDLNPVIGTEQAGTRPALVLQIDHANMGSPHTIIAPFTSKIRAPLFVSHVLVPAGIGGLSLDSVLLCEQIRVVDKRRFVHLISHLDKDYMDKVDKALIAILGIQ